MAPAFQERSLFAEGNAAAFQIAVGGGSASGSLRWGADEDEITRFLSETMSLARQMQTAMGSGPTLVQILVAEPQAGSPRQSALQIALEPSGAAVVTPPAGGGSHLVAMLQNFLMVLAPASRYAA